MQTRRRSRQTSKGKQKEAFSEDDEESNKSSSPQRKMARIKKESHEEREEGEEEEGVESVSGEPSSDLKQPGVVQGDVPAKNKAERKLPASRQTEPKEKTEKARWMTPRHRDAIKKRHERSGGSETYQTAPVERSSFELDDQDDLYVDVGEAPPQSQAKEGSHPFTRHDESELNVTQEEPAAPKVGRRYSLSSEERDPTVAWTAPAPSVTTMPRPTTTQPIVQPGRLASSSISSQRNGTVAYPTTRDSLRASTVAREVIGQARYSVLSLGTERLIVQMSERIEKISNTVEKLLETRKHEPKESASD